MRNMFERLAEEFELYSDVIAWIGGGIVLIFLVGIVQGVSYRSQRLDVDVLTNIEFHWSNQPVLVYRCEGQPTHTYDLKTREVSVNTPQKLKMLRTKIRLSALDFGIDRPVIDALLGGSAAGITLKSLGDAAQKIRAQKLGVGSKWGKYRQIAIGTLAVFSGYSVGKFIGTHAFESDCNSESVHELLNDRRIWDDAEDLFLVILQTRLLDMMQEVVEPGDAYSYNERELLEEIEHLDQRARENRLRLFDFGEENPFVIAAAQRKSIDTFQRIAKLIQRPRGSSEVLEYIQLTRQLIVTIRCNFGGAEILYTNDLEEGALREWLQDNLTSCDKSVTPRAKEYWDRTNKALNGIETKLIAGHG